MSRSKGNYDQPSVWQLKCNNIYEVSNKVRATQKTQNLCSNNNVGSNLEVRSVEQEKQLLLIVLQGAVLKLLCQLIFCIWGGGRLHSESQVTHGNSSEIKPLYHKLIIRMLEKRLSLHPLPDRRRCAELESGCVSHNASVCHGSVTQMTMAYSKMASTEEIQAKSHWRVLCHCCNQVQVCKKKKLHRRWQTYDRLDTPVPTEAQSCADPVSHLHEVPKAPFTEDILEEPQVLLVIGVWVELRGEQGQSLMKPYGTGANT